MSQQDLKIEPGKQYRTRDGHLMEVHSIDRGLIRGVALLTKTAWELQFWQSDGKYSEQPGPLDIVALAEPGVTKAHVEGAPTREMLDKHRRAFHRLTLLAIFEAAALAGLLLGFWRRVC